jgi:hypothetical membrane protein
VLDTPSADPVRHPISLTKALLACGLIAGPLFIVAVIAQALIRAGFDITGHALSLLSVADLGWIQITNFEVSGVLFVAFAVGMWRALHPSRVNVGTAAAWRLRRSGLDRRRDLHP